MDNFNLAEDTGRNDIALTARKILEKKIDDAIEKYPRSLEIKHLIEITGTSKDTVYRAVKQGQIPSAKKIMGIWRVPALPFFAWWFGNDEQ